MKPETCAAAIFSREGEGEPLALNSVIFRLELPALMARIIFGADISLSKMVFRSHSNSFQATSASALTSTMTSLSGYIVARGC